MTDKDYLIELGQRVRTARNNASLTLVELSNLINIHYSSISMIECGRSAPNILTIKKIADALKVSVNELV